VANLQIRNVSPKLHAELRRRAKKRGETMSRFIANILEREMALPPMDDVLDYIEGLDSIESEESSAETIRRLREERTAELSRRLNKT
jgi:antitoxin FitA